MTALRIAAFDHLVLNVADAEASAQWYEDKLGLQPVRLAEWRAGEAPFVSLRVDEGTIIDLQETARTGENCGHICLVLGEDVDLAAVAESGERQTANCCSD